MADTIYVDGTVVEPAWLNDVNTVIYKASITLPATTLTWSGLNVTHSGNHTWTGSGIYTSALSLSRTAASSGYIESTNTGAQDTGFRFSNSLRIWQIYADSTNNGRLKIRDSSNAVDRVTISDTGAVNVPGDLQINGGGTLGYTTGAGGTVTQATSKSTAVTLNKATGVITMNGAALAAGATVAFAVNNSLISSTDLVIPNLKTGYATIGTYNVWVESIGAGQFYIVVRNISGGSLSEALIIGFAIIKSAST